MADEQATVRDDADVALEEYRHILELRRRHLVTVDQPLVLISQIPRSGGTLLMRLLEGHPECHAVPHELRISLAKLTPEELKNGTDKLWASTVGVKLTTRYFWRGYGNVNERLNRDTDVYPFLLPPGFNRELFDFCLAQHEEPTQRDIVNCFMTAYFNAWLDNQNLYDTGKKWVTAFRPRVPLGQLSAYRKVYPDGRFISIVRNPVTWYASARRWSAKGEWERPEDAVEAWLFSMKELEAAKGRFGEALLVLPFEDLVARTQATMERIAVWLGIRFTESLLVPTFNRIPIKPNSSFVMAGAGIESDPVEDRRAGLSPDDVAYIEERTGEAYQSALTLCVP